MLSQKAVSTRKITLWALAFLALTNLPYLVAWLLPPEGKQFSGTFVNPDDLSTYLAAIRQGAEGHWLFHFPFSPEPWQPKLMLLPYLLVGKIAGLLGGSPLLWFHLFRLTAVTLTLFILFIWVKTIFPNRPRLQQTGWLVIVFGSGLGWLVAILRLSPSLPIDIGMPEWSIFMALFHTPHFALGLGLELLFFTAVHAMVTKSQTWRWAGLSALAGIVLALTYVYLIPVAGLVVGLLLLVVAIRQRRIPWRLWLGGGLVLLPLTAMLAYYLIIANQDPYFAYYAQQEHVIPPPSPLAALVGVGLLGGTALVSLRHWWREQRPLLVPLWLGANVLLLYLPLVSYSARFALGLMVPTATLAAYGLETILLPWLQARPFFPHFATLTPTPVATLHRVLIMLLIPSTFIGPLLLTKTAVTATDFPTYLPSSEMAAVAWLGEHSQAEDLTFAYYPIANTMPRAIPGKVFLGQLDFTTDLSGKLALMELFWQTETPLAWRLAFLNEWGIDYIYVGQYERSLGADAINVPGTAVYDQNGVIIYQVGSD